jgi:hypothetical protein
MAAAPCGTNAFPRFAAGEAFPQFSKHWKQQIQLMSFTKSLAVYLQLIGKASGTLALLFV